MEHKKPQRNGLARQSESLGRRDAGRFGTNRTAKDPARSRLSSTGALDTLSGGSGSAELLALQALAGNRAVARSLVVARQPVTKAGSVPKVAQKELGREYEARIDRVIGATAKRHQAVVRSIQAGVGHVDASVNALNAVADKYESAYERVQSTIKEGEGELAAQEAWAQAILGIAIGTGVGMALGAVTVFAKSASHGAELVGKVITEMSGETVEFGAAQGLNVLGPGGGGGGEAFLERMNPLLRRLEIYRQASAMYRELALLAPKLGALGALAKPASALKADSRELAVQGTLSGTRSVEQLKSQVEQLETAGAQAAAAERDVVQLLGKAAEAQVTSEREAKTQDERRLERQLWIGWMASLSGDKDIDVLRSGPVRDKLKYLGFLNRDRYGGSDIGWNVGALYTESESEWGIDIAKQVSMAITFIGREAPITGTSKERLTPSTYGTVEFKDMPWYKRSWKVFVDAQKDWVNDGDMVRITHVWGEGDKQATLYGRLVSSSEPDEAWSGRARYRRELV